jgi:dCMP deaminase
MNDFDIKQWDRRFLELASFLGAWSKDRSAQTGCVIVGADRLVRSTGYNGFARGIDDDVASRHERPAKYSWTEHAERNAIYNAARLGISIENCTAYVNWFPCIECARAFIQVGLIRIVGIVSDYSDSKWGSDFTLATEMLSEVNIETVLYNFPELSARHRKS